MWLAPSLDLVRFTILCTCVVRVSYTYLCVPKIVSSIAMVATTSRELITVLRIFQF
jgi:hypothetical protein